MNWLLLLFYFGVSYSYAVLEQSKLEKLKNVKYLGYTREKQSDHVDIRDIDCSGNVTTVFIIHGFFKISLLEPMTLKDDIFKYDADVSCVIVVSWLYYSTYSDKLSYGSKDLNYHVIAKQHVPYLSQDINEKLQYIRNRGAGKIELIGHSLGAHAAGQAARLFKRNTGDEIQRIIGLDPAGRYFDNNPQVALKGTDAKNVTIFHTNTHRYGSAKEIGAKHVYVNGGKKQPACKLKMTDDICSHSQAWTAYTDQIKNKTIDKKGPTRLHSNRFVLCVDVSLSMDENLRLLRAISSGKKLFSTMTVGSYIGIVEFSDKAETTHKIIQIEGEAERNSLISKLPQTTIGATSIGAGLRLSMEMLMALPESDKFCSTIILLTDGMQNTKPAPEDVLPELRKNCIGVNSVALGAQASDDLENISSQTGGEVVYAMENDNAQQISDTDRAFRFSYENEIDPDILPIYLRTQRMPLNNSENVVSFFIDDKIGKDTEFMFTSEDIATLDVKLISPKGQIYTYADAEYTDDSSNKQKSYKIALAEPGKWHLVATKVSKTRRSIRSISEAVVTVRTHQLNDKIPPIRLDAILSNRTLEYPKTNKQSDIEQSRIIISAGLRRGRFPVIQAEVFAHIYGLNQSTITFKLHDNGLFPDELANDGVYTGLIIKLPKPERYSVIVTAASEIAKLVPKEVDYFDRDVIDCDRIDCETINYFEREAYVGAIKLVSLDESGEKRIPPNQITDLRAMVRNESQRLLSLEWTSPADDVFKLYIKRYDVRALVDGLEFENGFRLDESHFLEGSLDATNSSSGRKEMVLLRIPSEIWKYDKKMHGDDGFFLELTFAVKAFSKDDVKSQESNLASVVLKDKVPVMIVGRKACKRLQRNIYPYGILYVTFC